MGRSAPLAERVIRHRGGTCAAKSYVQRHGQPGQLAPLDLHFRSVSVASYDQDFTLGLCGPSDRPRLDLQAAGSHIFGLMGPKGNRYLT